MTRIFYRPQTIRVIEVPLYIMILPLQVSCVIYRDDIISILAK